MGVETISPEEEEEEEWKAKREEEWRRQQRQMMMEGEQRGDTAGMIEIPRARARGGGGGQQEEEDEDEEEEDDADKVEEDEEEAKDIGGSSSSRRRRRRKRGGEDQQWLSPSSAMGEEGGLRRRWEQKEEESSQGRPPPPPAARLSSRLGPHDVGRDQGDGGVGDGSSPGTSSSSSSSSSGVSPRPPLRFCHESLLCMTAANLVTYYCQGLIITMAGVALDPRVVVGNNNSQHHPHQPRPGQWKGVYGMSTGGGAMKWLWITVMVTRFMGALLFGHLGDRVGRRVGLSCSLAVVALATCLIAFVPTITTTSSPPSAAPALVSSILWVILSALQGVGVGGEWAGALIVPYELAQNDKERALAPALAYAASPLGLAAGVAVMDRLILFSSSSHHLWRAAFVMGGVAAAMMAVWVPLNGGEAAVFEEMRDRGLLPTGYGTLSFTYILRHWPMASLIGVGMAALTTLTQDYITRAWSLLLPPLPPSPPVLSLLLLVTSLAVVLGALLVAFACCTGGRTLFITMCTLIGTGSYTYLLTITTRGASSLTSRVAMVVGTLGPVLGLLQSALPLLLCGLFDTCSLYTGTGLTYHAAYLLTALLWPRIVSIRSTSSSHSSSGGDDYDDVSRNLALLTLAVAVLSGLSAFVSKFIDGARPLPFFLPHSRSHSGSLRVRDCVPPPSTTTTSSSTQSNTNTSGHGSSSSSTDAVLLATMETLPPRRSSASPSPSSSPSSAASSRGGGAGARGQEEEEGKRAHAGGDGDDGPPSVLLQPFFTVWVGMSGSTHHHQSSGPGGLPPLEEEEEEGGSRSSSSASTGADTARTASTSALTRGTAEEQEIIAP